MGIIVFAIIRYLEYIQKENNRRFSEKELLKGDGSNLSLSQRNKAIRQVVASDGIDPNHTDYLIINDAEKKVYTRTFTICALPKRCSFESTFARVLNFVDNKTKSGIRTSIFVEPVDSETISDVFDRQVTILDGEQEAALKDKDRNRARKISQKIGDVEYQASLVELNKDRYFKVTAAFTITAPSLEDLGRASDAFVLEARKSRIYLTVCYGTQAEAYNLQLPLNSRTVSAQGIRKYANLKTSFFTIGPVASLYNFSSDSFFHKNGVVLGKLLGTNQIATYDIYDPSHTNGYCMIIAGMVGSGKSVAMKSLPFRYYATSQNIDDFTTVVIDRQRPAGYTESEYCPLCRALNGEIFTISTNSEKVINPFDIETELSIIRNANNQIVGEELTLNLNQQIGVIIDQLKMLLFTRDNKAQASLSYERITDIDNILQTVCQKLYTEQGIMDGNPESLYLMQNGMKIKKRLPTISDCVKKLLIMAADANQSYLINKETLSIIIKGLSMWVKEIYYSPKTMRFYTREEYESLPVYRGVRYGLRKEKDHFYPDKDDPIEVIKGVRSYFDGQSSIDLSNTTNTKRMYVFDISGLSETEQTITNTILMTFVNEKFVKKNSENPLKMKKLLVLYDEFHYILRDAYARKIAEVQFRTARKKNVALIIATQSMCDFAGTTEGETILKNTQTKMIFKHAPIEKNSLKMIAQLTDSEANKVITLGGESNQGSTVKRPGEVLIIDGGKKTFLRVSLFEFEKRLFSTDPNTTSINARLDEQRRNAG